MDHLFPKSLGRKQFELLKIYVQAAAGDGMGELLQQAERHLKNAVKARESNSFVNVPLAAALYQSIMAMASQFDRLPPLSQPWCRGMISYFAARADEENDFNSPIGFEDDAEVINACLRFAGLEDLCINPEDYDEF
ncbi:MAG: hypothetical protein V1816_18330 [Pseudomonadota bacterium]